jgi:HEAT repeat protein
MKGGAIGRLETTIWIPTSPAAPSFIRREITVWYAIKIAISLLLSLFFCSSGSASRIHQTMDEYVRQASVIALVDTAKKPGGWETVLTFREMIRGPAELVGKTHVIPFGNVSSGDVHISPDLTNVAVLLKQNWQKEEKPAIEMYQQPHEIDALKILARIYELPGEESQLRSLSDRFDDGNSLLQEQLLHDLQHMKEKSNFHFIAELLQVAYPETQRKVIEIMQRIGDSRAVPGLIDTMKQSHLTMDLRKRAAEALFDTFSEAPGVAETLKELPELSPAQPTVQLTSWQKADQALQHGNVPEAKEGFLAIVEEEKESPFTRLAAAQKIMESLSDAERETLRKPLLMLFEKKEARNYLTDRDFVDLFRKLKHPDCLEPLVNLMISEQSVEQTTARNAVMAILDLGPASRKKAAARLMEKVFDIASGNVLRSFYNGTHPYFLALAWIGDSDSHRAAREALKKSKLEEYWKPVVTLLGASDQRDETEFLLAAFERSRNTEVQEWIVFRLGDLRDHRAVDAIGQYLLKLQNNWSYTAKESLIKIGGPEVERLAYDLLTAHAEFVRKEAVEILAAQMPKAEFLVLVREMIKEENLGDRQSALFHLGQIGTSEDLKLLEPYLDYWTSDRSLHYWAMTAAASIRQRHK